MRLFGLPQFGPDHEIPRVKAMPWRIYFDFVYALCVLSMDLKVGFLSEGIVFSVTRQNRNEFHAKRPVDDAWKLRSMTESCVGRKAWII